MGRERRNETLTCKSAVWPTLIGTLTQERKTLSNVDQIFYAYQALFRSQVNFVLHLFSLDFGTDLPDIHNMIHEYS